jgi:hypothetical protein
MRLLPVFMAKRILILGLAMIAAPLFAQSESLGDVVRQQREQRQSSGLQHKVWTNEALGIPEEGNAPPNAAAADNAGKTDGQEAKGSAPAKAGENGAAEKADAKDGAKDAKKGDAEKGGADRKVADHPKRADDGTNPYVDRIAAVRGQIESAKKELAQLQRDQIESRNQFRNSNGQSVPLAEYNDQQQTLQQQIDDREKTLVDLDRQLDDAREAARHAGVPHASEY